MPCTVPAARFVPALAVCVTALLAATAGADSFYFTPDVPALLNGSNYLPWNIVRDDASGAYTIPSSLPAGYELDALYHDASGAWYYSFKTQVTLGGTNFYREDVVKYDVSTGYTLAFDGSPHLVAASWNVDAVFLDSLGDLILSFDIPATLGGATYEPADLVRWAGGSFSLFFDASAAGIPSSSNVTGADVNGALTVITLDTPTSVGAATYLPGQLVSWDGVSLASYYSNAGWPLAIHRNALSFLADPGAVGTITLSKLPLAPGVIQLEWTPSCSAGAEDYGIYEGTIGNWASHVPIDCFDDGRDNMEAVTPSGTMNYYLVVPRNADYEGSYGQDSNLTERIQSIPACVNAQRLGTCP
jgi:hypothetical protein